MGQGLIKSQCTHDVVHGRFGQLNDSLCLPSPINRDTIRYAQLGYTYFIGWGTAGPPLQLFRLHWNCSASDESLFPHRMQTVSNHASRHAPNMPHKLHIDESRHHAPSSSSWLKLPSSLTPLAALKLQCTQRGKRVNWHSYPSPTLSLNQIEYLLHFKFR